MPERPPVDTDEDPDQRADQDAVEEIRFAVVLNGGVSLAVWMAGVARELDLLTRRHGVYGDILTALASRARVDVIAGTSAGGINGACLAVAQAYPTADLGVLRDLWARQGSMKALLHKPGADDPGSLLQGNDVFWPALRDVFRRLLTDPGRAGDDPVPHRPPADRPVRLVLTTTLLKPRPQTVTDSLGVEVHQPVREGKFFFERGQRDDPDRDDFAATAPRTSTTVANELALASRCSASFPVAFEPVFVPIGTSPKSCDVRPDDIRPDDIRPDMADRADFESSRWVVDGGILLNTPLEPVLDAVVRAPATIQTRRLLVLVVPDPYVVTGEDKQPDEVEREPGIRAVLWGMATAWQAETFAADLAELERRNASATLRRRTRTDLLADLPEGDELVSLAERLFFAYRSIRVGRAAAHIAGLAAPRCGRTVADVADGLVEEMSNARGLPFVPESIDAVEGWAWGIAALERLSVTVLDLLRRAIWVAPAGDEGRTSGSRRELEELRAHFYEQVGALAAERRQETAYWRRPDIADRFDRSTALELVAGAPTRQPVLGQIADQLLDIAYRTARKLRPADGAGVDHPWTSVDEASRLERLVHRFDVVDRQERRRRALALEVCYVCMVDPAQNGQVNEQMVELVTIGAGVEHHFPGIETPEPLERVAGLRLGHFASFLKQAWRVNDWTWGRLDAANRLVTALLDPERLQHAVALRAYPVEPSDEHARAVLRTLFGVDADEELPVEVGTRAVLDALLGAETEGNDRVKLQPVVDALVTRIAEGVVAADSDALARAVEADRVDRDDSGSRGQQWLRRRVQRTGQGAEAP